MKTWFISDLHLHHKNILKYEPSRIRAICNYLCEHRNKYKDLVQDFSYEEIELAINNMLKYDHDKAINIVLDIHDNMLIDNWNKVVKGDDIVWFLGDLSLGNREYTQTVAAKLNGHKKMIMGNHDRWSEEFYKSCGFEFVSNYPVILKHHFILSHAPMNNIGNLVNVFGHVHSHYCDADNNPNNICVCVERQNFTPRNIPAFDSYVEEEQIYE